MIVCKLELWPGGNERAKEHLGTIEIANDVRTTIDTSGRRGTYLYELFKKRPNRVFSSGEFANFPRKSYHPWNLVRGILNQVAEANDGKI